MTQKDRKVSESRFRKSTFKVSPSNIIYINNTYLNILSIIQYLSLGVVHL